MMGLDSLHPSVDSYFTQDTNPVCDLLTLASILNLRKEAQTKSANHTGAPNENIVQKHLSIALLNVF